MTRKEFKAMSSFARWNGYTMKPKHIPTWDALEKTKGERFILADRNNVKEKLLPGDGDIKMRKYWGSRLWGFKTGYLKSNK
jgi:hypothetical protein